MQLLPIPNPSNQDSHTPYAEDLQLVARMVLREPEAWQSFIHRFGPILQSRVADVASSFGRGNDRSCIEDALAEVFSSLLAKDAAPLRAFLGNSSLITYVAVIATRVATRFYVRRRIAERKCRPLCAEILSVEDPQQQPMKQLLGIEQRDQLLSLIERLPEKQQRVLRLFYLQGESYAEISRILGIPIGSVGVTLRRAADRLKEFHGVEHLRDGSKASSDPQSEEEPS